MKLEKMSNCFGLSVTSQKVIADLEEKNQKMKKRMEEMEEIMLSISVATLAAAVTLAVLVVKSVNFGENKQREENMDIDISRERLPSGSHTGKFWESSLVSDSDNL